MKTDLGDRPGTATEIRGGGDRPESIASRLLHFENNGLADYIVAAKYARYLPHARRWENWTEASDRVESMHRDYFGGRLLRRIGADVASTAADPADYRLLLHELGGVTLDRALLNAFIAVAAKRVLPSMRSLQFGGAPILRNQARLFNCAFSPVDRIEFFREYFFLLLSGTGCGFSVQRGHVERLPALPAGAHEGTPARLHVVADSIEGWADALHMLLRSYWESFTARFDYSQVRARGQPLRTAGGFASGPEPLRRALSDVGGILRRSAGRKLRPIEVYDLCMFVSRAVLSGGVRRSASICLFSPDDNEMLHAKAGAWLSENPQRAACNNSVVLPRATYEEAKFRQMFEVQKEFGEPGFYFSDSPEYGCNPCGEAGLHPVLTELDEDQINQLRELGYGGDLSPKARLSGWQMCNLTTINGTILREPREFFRACIHAAVIGTLQAAYTDMPYLGPVTRRLNERDALLGVSICGFMDNPEFLLAPSILERGARICRATNELVAAALGIRAAARVTCVKPEGTASLLLGAAAGIHPRPAGRYFRRVQADRRDPVFQRFRTVNPRMTEASRTRPEADDVIVFPIEAPAGAITREQIGAVEFLERVLLVRTHWVLPGEAPTPRSPGLHHNVSHTCAVRLDEWNDVADFIWQHREEFSGVALLGDNAVDRYPEPAFQAVVSRREVERWNQLGYRVVEYVDGPASDANAPPMESDACVAGVCDA